VVPAVTHEPIEYLLRGARAARECAGDGALVVGVGGLAGQEQLVAERAPPRAPVMQRRP